MFVNRSRLTAGATYLTGSSVAEPERGQAQGRVHAASDASQWLLNRPRPDQPGYPIQPRYRTLIKRLGDYM
jgi:hypothetical protein